MDKYLNFTFQINKYKKTDKDAEWVGYFKNANGTRTYFVKIFKNNGQYGEYMSGSIDLEKLPKQINIENDNIKKDQSAPSTFQEEETTEEYPF